MKNEKGFVIPRKDSVKIQFVVRGEKVDTDGTEARKEWRRLC